MSNFIANAVVAIQARITTTAQQLTQQLNQITNHVQHAANPLVVAFQTAQASQAAQQLQNAAQGLTNGLNPTIAKLQLLGKTTSNIVSPAIKNLGLDTRDLAVLLGAGLTGSGIVLALRGLKALVTSTIEAASAFEEQESATKQLFEANSELVLSFAEQATAFNLSRREALETVNSFGPLLQNLGFSEEAAAKFSIGLTKLAADITSFKNTGQTAERAAQALRSALIGETEPLRRLGFGFNQAAVDARAMELNFKAVNGVISPFGRGLAAIDLELERTAKAHGDAALTQESFANTTRRLRVEIENLQASLGEGVLPALSGFLGVLNDIFAGLNLLTGAIDKLIPGLNSMRILMEAAFVGIAFLLGGPIVAGITAIILGIANITGAFSDHGSQVAKVQKNYQDLRGEIRILAQQAGDVETQFKGDLEALTELGKQFTKEISDAIEEIRSRTTKFIPEFGKEFSDQTQRTIRAARELDNALRRQTEIREQQARRVADARARLEEVEETSNRKVRDAEERLGDVVEQTTRRVRDARRALADAMRETGERVGDTERRLQETIVQLSVASEISLADAFRLRDARIDAARAKEDEARRVGEAQEELNETIQDGTIDQERAERDAKEAAEERAEDVAKARQDLVRAEQDAAREIADAARQVAEAMEDSAEKSELSLERIRNSFVTNAKDIAAFERNFVRIRDTIRRLESLGPERGGIRRDVGEAFLARVLKLGPEAGAAIADLAVVDEDKLIENFVVPFQNTFDTALRLGKETFAEIPVAASDALGAAAKGIESEIRQHVIGMPAALLAQSPALNAAFTEELNTLLGKFVRFKEGTGEELTDIQQALITVATDIQLGPEKRIDAVNALLDSMTVKDYHIVVTADVEKAMKEAQKLKNKLDEKVDHEGWFAKITRGIKETILEWISPEGLKPSQLSGLDGRQHGGPVRAGMPYIVGEKRAELFIPETNGRIVPEIPYAPHRTVNQYVTINEVANDPLATSRAVSARLAKEATR